MPDVNPNQIGSLRLVVAEDEAIIRMDLVEMLEEQGFEVVAAVGDGQAAVDATSAHRPDVVLLDVAMPVRDGLSAAEEITREGWAPVIMVTAFSQAETVQRAAEAGAFGFLVKPFGPADLGPAIAVARARWQQARDLAVELAGVSERAHARERVEMAKSLVQRASGMTEPEAFAWLRGLAMDRRVTLAEVSAGVCDGQIHPPQGR
jgi:AmiR/NasT family two-component response regulator